jgi:hypothetical protein
MVYFGTEAKPYKEPEVVKDTIVESVVNRFKERSEVGIAKYGTTMDRKDLSTLEWLQHLQEEMFDGILYIEKLKSKQHIIDIMKADEELGLYANTFSGTTSSTTNNSYNVVECKCK